MSKPSPMITTLFDPLEGEELSNGCYRDILTSTLKKLLPPEFFENKENFEETLVHQKKIIQKKIPLIICSGIEKAPGTLSFCSLSKSRPNAFKFFFEMISRWLTPGRRLNVVLVYTTDFRLSPTSEEIYTICEVMMSISDPKELEEIRQNFSIIETEIALGIHSEFYANRILEIKGLTADDKTAIIQGYIALLVKRFPKYYDQAVFTEMQHVLVTCLDDFKAERHARHLSRMICIQYLFRKGLREAIKKNPNKRYVNLKVFRAMIRTKNGNKRALSFLIGMNFIRDQENFGERNLIKAIQHFIPSAIPIEDSFYIHKRGSESICLAYMEMEKKDGSSFSASEIRKLRRELSGNLKNRIEHRLHTVFMPRNEEEVMRNILTLTNQIRYVRDIPQVAITFEEQAPSHLYFTVILARLLKANSLPISDMFRTNKSSAEYLHDRTKIMGHLRKKYPKEATVFRLKLPKEGFLRADHSIDLYKARQTVVDELSKVVGEVRDFNGGMISKQHEMLSHIRTMLADIKDYDELLLENLFYSLASVVVRALLNPTAFKKFFLMLLEGIKEYKSESSYIKYLDESTHFFALVIVEDLMLKDAIREAVLNLHLPTNECAYVSLRSHGYFCLGYFCFGQDLRKRQLIRDTIENQLALVI